MENLSLKHYADPYLKIPFQIHSFSRLADDVDESAPVDPFKKCPGSWKYVHPRYPSIAFWIIQPLPFPSAIYHNELELKIKCCDAVFLLDVTLSSEDSLKLAMKVRRPNTEVFFVRTKVDINVREEKRKRPFDESALLERIRTEVLRHLEDLDLFIPSKNVFLISSYYPDKWDFSRLEEAILALSEQWELRRLKDSFQEIHKVKSISGTGTNVILMWVTYCIS